VGMAALKMMTTPTDEQGEPGMVELFQRGELNELEAGRAGVKKLARAARRQRRWHEDV